MEETTLKEESAIAPTISEGLKPEWLTIRDTTKVFAIGRSRIYELISRGKIKSHSIRERGKVSGRRVVSYDSVAAYIESFAP